MSEVVSVIVDSTYDCVMSSVVTECTGWETVCDSVGWCLAPSIATNGGSTAGGYSVTVPFPDREPDHRYVICHCGGISGGMSDRTKVLCTVSVGCDASSADDTSDEGHMSCVACDHRTG